MRLRTFNAADMQQAMQMVRDSLGDEAVIISTQTQDSNHVQVTAAFDDVETEPVVDEYDEWFGLLRDEQAHPAPVTEQRGSQWEPVPEWISDRIAAILYYHSVNEGLQTHLLARLSQLTTQHIIPYQHYANEVERWLTTLLAETFQIVPLHLQYDSCRHILIGPPGAGKTLTTAKIAAYCVKYNQPVHVITTDNKRAGGVEQLNAITDILGIELQVAENRQSLKHILSDIPLAETVIVDSAGANPYDFYELKQLAEFASLIELDPVLIYPAGCDPFEADEVSRAFSFIGVERMIITRIDTARRFGSILNAAYAGGLKFCNFTGSEKILGSFDPCTPGYLASLFTNYQPQHYGMETELSGHYAHQENTRSPISMEKD